MQIFETFLLDDNGSLFYITKNVASEDFTNEPSYQQSRIAIVIHACYRITMR